MKKIALLVFSLISTSLNATSIPHTNVSPYVDLTLNTQWNSEYQDLEPMDYKTIALDNQIHAYHLAFLVDSGHCQAAWGGQSTYQINDQWGKRLTDSLAQQNIDLTVSFGGANGNDLSMNCTEQELVNIFNQTITTYQAKKLDFDIENGTTNISKLISALQQFQQQNPKIKLSLTLPTLPDGLTWIGKDIVSQAVMAKLNFNINIMAMDYGPAYQIDMGEAAISAAKGLYEFLKAQYPKASDAELWQKVEITPMIGVNDTTNEQFTLANAKRLNSFAIQQHLGGLAMWSLNRDRPCSDTYANISCSGNNLQQSNYEFIHTLNIL